MTDNTYFEHNGRTYQQTADGRVLYGLITVPDPRIEKPIHVKADGSQTVVQLDDYRLKK